MTPPPCVPVTHGQTRGQGEDLSNTPQASLTKTAAHTVEPNTALTTRALEPRAVVVENILQFFQQNLTGTQDKKRER